MGKVLAFRAPRGAVTSKSTPGSARRCGSPGSTRRPKGRLLFFTLPSSAAKTAAGSCPVLA
ncbi:MAG: hypothetical protein U0166_20885 [Acidobacteriota bacterium]